MLRKLAWAIQSGSCATALPRPASAFHSGRNGKEGRDRRVRFPRTHEGRLWRTRFRGLCGGLDGVAPICVGTLCQRLAAGMRAMGIGMRLYMGVMDE